MTRFAEDHDWTQALLAMEETYRTSPGLGFHDQMEVQLRESDLILVRWLAERPSGRDPETLMNRDHLPTLERITDALQEEHQKELTPAQGMPYVTKTIKKRLSGQHLGLLRPLGSLEAHAAGTVKWAVSDLFARFQLRVLEPAVTVTAASDLDDDNIAENRASALAQDWKAGVRKDYAICSRWAQTICPRRAPSQHATI